MASRMESDRDQGLPEVGEDRMKPTNVPLKKALNIVLFPFPGLPKLKVWRLRDPEMDRSKDANRVRIGKKSPQNRENGARGKKRLNRAF